MITAALFLHILQLHVQLVSKRTLFFVPDPQISCYSTLHTMYTILFISHMSFFNVVFLIFFVALLKLNTLSLSEHIVLSCAETLVYLHKQTYILSELFPFDTDSQEIIDLPPFLHCYSRGTIPDECPSASATLYNG